MSIFQMYKMGFGKGEPVYSLLLGLLILFMGLSS